MWQKVKNTSCIIKETLWTLDMTTWRQDSGETEWKHSIINWYPFMIYSKLFFAINYGQQKVRVNFLSNLFHLLKSFSNRPIFFSFFRSLRFLYVFSVVSLFWNFSGWICNTDLVSLVKFSKLKSVQRSKYLNQTKLLKLGNIVPRISAEMSQIEKI